MLARLEHVAVVGHLERGARVLLDQQDASRRCARSRSMMRKISRTTSGARPRLGSSSISSLGCRHQRAADREHLALAARQRAGELRAALLQAREQRRTRARARAASVGTRQPHLRGSRRAAGCLPPACVPNSSRVLGHQRHAQHHALFERAASARSWPSKTIVPRDGQHAHQRVQQGRLAGAVRADDGDDLPALGAAGSGRAAPRRGRSRRAGR